MKNAIEKKQNNLPTWENLISDIDVAQKNDQLNFLLNQDPPKGWVKKHPYISNYNYLPIDKIEYLLRRIFREYNVEVLEHKMILNAVSVRVRVHFKNPTTNQWQFHDGVGAQEIQTKKDTGSLNPDMSNVNRGAVMMALPIAKTIAIKDACDHFGRLFGCDLNRKDLADNTINKSIQDIDINKLKQKTQ